MVSEKKKKKAKPDIKAVIFDFGGVVANKLGLFTKKKIKDMFNISIKEVKKHYYELIGPFEKGKINEKEFWEKCAKKLKKDLPKNHCVGVFGKDYIKVSKIKKPVWNLVKKLKKNYLVPLLSNSIEPHTQCNFKHKRYRLFKPVFISDKIGMRKPNKNIYYYMIKKLKLGPGECVFVDNQIENVKAANSVGIHGVHFTTKTKLVKDLKKLGVKIPK